MVNSEEQLETLKNELELKQKLSLLEKPEQAYYLDIGHKEDHFWFGFKNKGKDWIITSKKELLLNSLEKVKDKEIGENQIPFKYLHSLGEMAPLISIEAISEFVNSKKYPIISPKYYYNCLKVLINNYMDFGNEPEIVDVIACWAIATYYYPLFDWFPHLLINAPSGSGKTKCGEMIMKLSFRGFNLSAAAGLTPATIYRTLEENRGTIFIDEFESIEKSESQQLVNQILNASSSRDSYIIRLDKEKDKWSPRKFPIFCPKIICNISGLNETTESRCILLKWSRSLNPEKNRNKPTDPKADMLFQWHKDQLHILALQDYRLVKDTYKTLKLDNLNARIEDNWKPLYAIAKAIESDIGEDLGIIRQLDTFIANNCQDGQDMGEDVETVFKAIYDALEDVPQRHTCRGLSQMINLSGIIGSYIKSPEKWLGKKLKIYHIEQKRVSSMRYYLLDKNSFKEKLKGYFSFE